MESKKLHLVKVVELDSVDTEYTNLELGSVGTVVRRPDLEVYVVDFGENFKHTRHCPPLEEDGYRMYEWQLELINEVNLKSELEVMLKVKSHIDAIVELLEGFANGV